MSYTKKNLNAITLLLTILIFVCLYLISSQISLLLNSTYSHNSNTVYSKTIPIQEQNETIKLISTSNNITDNLISYAVLQEKSDIPMSNLIQDMEQAKEEIGEWNTQRQVIQANKTNTWRIQIPKLGLDVHIEEGTTSSVLLQAVGHFEGTATWNGNVCLAGHNRGYLCNFFQKIKNLKVGDEIIYYTEQGKRVYKVQTNKVILETDWSYIEETEDNRITLITCEENRPEYRRCVQAMQVSERLK